MGPDWGVCGAAFLVLINGIISAPSTTLTLLLALRCSVAPKLATNWAACWTVASEAIGASIWKLRLHKGGREPVVKIKSLIPAKILPSPDTQMFLHILLLSCLIHKYRFEGPPWRTINLCAVVCQSY